MAFSQEQKTRRAAAVGWQCECTRLGCGHYGRCTRRLLPGAWEAHHRTALLAGGTDADSNLECLCIPCHSNTASFGRS